MSWILIKLYSSILFIDNNPYPLSSSYPSPTPLASVYLAQMSAQLLLPFQSSSSALTLIPRFDCANYNHDLALPLLELDSREACGANVSVMGRGCMAEFIKNPCGRSAGEGKAVEVEA